MLRSVYAVALLFVGSLVGAANEPQPPVPTETRPPTPWGVVTSTHTDPLHSEEFLAELEARLESSIKVAKRAEQDAAWYAQPLISYIMGAVIGYALGWRMAVRRHARHRA